MSLSLRTTLDLKNKEKNLYSKVEIDRSNWKKELLEKNAEIGKLLDMIYSINRSITFGQIYAPKKKDTKFFSSEEIYQLILQHLHYEGLKKSRKILEELCQKQSPSLIDLKESRLLTLLRITLKEVERTWELTIADKWMDEDENYQDICEHLYDLGMLDDSGTSSEDINIWDEPEKDNIIYVTASNGKQVIKAATLNKLVQQLTSENNHDMEFQKTFLLTYQSFTTPENLLKKLSQRYKVPENKFDVNQTKVIQLRVINVIRKWLEEHFHEFNDQQIESIQTFLDKHIKNTSEPLYRTLQGVIQKKIADNNMEEKKGAIFNELPPEPRVDMKTIFLPKLSFSNLDKIEIARQLTIIEWELFSRIKPHELLNQCWNKPKLRHRAGNVLAMINRSTEISGWVATTILKEEKLHNRTKMMVKFIKIAEQLRKLNNFSTLMAIIAGLNNSAVFRLKYTREDIPKQYQLLLDQLHATVSSAHSYKVYRETISKVIPPCIPYLGVYLTDLTFIDDGNPNFIQSPNGKDELINFNKRKLVYNVISQIQQFQQTSYNLQEVHQIKSLLTTEKLKKQKLSEKELFSLSQHREPRDVEKAQLL